MYGSEQDHFLGGRNKFIVGLNSFYPPIRINEFAFSYCMVEDFTLNPPSRTEKLQRRERFLHLPLKRDDLLKIIPLKAPHRLFPDTTATQTTQFFLVSGFRRKTEIYRDGSAAGYGVASPVCCGYASSASIRMSHLCVGALYGSIRMRVASLRVPVKSCRGAQLV